MRLISWNVNGLRACLQKDFQATFRTLDADCFCLQETKLQAGQLALELPGYRQYWSYAEKKGYSGTALFTRMEPLSVTYGVGVPELDTEGRLIAAEFDKFFLVTCYTPNAQEGLKRIDHRMAWDDAFRARLLALDAVKPVVACGDLNVAHQEIDLKNPGPNRGNAGFSDQERGKFTELLDAVKPVVACGDLNVAHQEIDLKNPGPNRGNAGFSDQERGKFTELLNAGFTDTFRFRNPDATGIYSWWSYRFNARKNNAGWRIDYFLVSDRIRDAIVATPIYHDIFGSDHCPVGLELKEDLL